MSRFVHKVKKATSQEAVPSDNPAAERNNVDEDFDPESAEYVQIAQQLAELAEGLLEGEDNADEDDDDADDDREAADAAVIEGLESDNDDDDMDEAIAMAPDDVKTGLLAYEKVCLSCRVTRYLR